MTAPAQKSIRWLALVGAMVFGMVLAGSAQALAVREVRIAANGGYDRCVVELDAPPVFRFRNASADESLVSIELSHVRGDATPRVSGALDRITSTWTDRPDPNGPLYVHMRTKGEVRVEAQTLDNPWRVVLDLYGPESPARPVGAQPAPRAVAAPDNVPVALAPPRAQGAYPPRVIVIDPGHGGHHRGGLGKVNGRMVDEAMTTLPVALRLEQLLRADPMFEPRLTRREDVYVSLRERTRRAERFNGNAFVSIHYNAVPKSSNPLSARGLEIFTWSPRDGDSVATRYLQALDNEEPGFNYEAKSGSARTVLNKMLLDALEEQATESRRFAGAVEGAFLRDSFFRRYNRGLKSARFKVLENYNMPSILVEVGFISHPEEAKLAVDPAFQQKVAQYLYDGLVEYYMKGDPAFRAARERRVASARR